MTKPVREELKGQECLVLKALVPLDFASKQQLTLGLPKEERTKYRLLSRATVSKALDKLNEKGMVTIEKGPRNADNCSITFRGFLHTMWDCDLADKEVQDAVKRWLETRTELWLWRQLVDEKAFGLRMFKAITNAIFKMRERVNLKYFNEEYANRTLTLLLAEELREILQGPKTLKATKKWAKRMFRKKRTAKFTLALLEDQLKVLYAVREKTRREIEQYEKTINSVRKIELKKAQ